ncbi:MAG: ABC transporter ATP-binding protein [Bdellovibrionota bacterium]
MDINDILRSRGLFKDFANLKKLWPYAKENKFLLTLAIVLIPAISATQVAQPLILQNAIDSGVLAGDHSKLNYYSIIFLFLVISEYLSRTAQSYTTALVVNKMILSLRKKLVTHILNLRLSFHDRSLSGALVTRATSDFDNLSESLSMGVLRSIVDLAALVGCAIGMLVLNWRLALISILVLPIIFWGIAWFSKILKTMMHSARAKLAALNAYTQECLYGNSTIKILTAGHNAVDKYNTMNKGYRNAQMQVVIMDSLIFSILDGIASIMIGLTLFAVVTEFFGTGMVTAGVIVAFVRYVQQLFEPLKQLGSTMAMLQGVFTAVDRIFGIMETKEFISGEQALNKIRGEVEFQNVSFSYSNKKDEKDRTVLKNINFHLPAGKSLALVGRTGSGKSTIIKLLSKLYNRYNGKILIDGIDLLQLDGEKLREKISIVPQDIVLFDGSVAFNIGLDDPSVSKEDIVEAAKIVGAHQFIKRLPGGYDFAIREQGANLSQGQRQLLVFARAIARKPNLVILDEATSSIDPKAETAIQHAIGKILQGRSVIVIAHRLSTIRKCDQILVMQEGAIAESGSHDKLISAKGLYHTLHQALSH